MIASFTPKLPCAPDEFLRRFLRGEVTVEQLRIHLRKDHVAIEATDFIDQKTGV